VPEQLARPIAHDGDRTICAAAPTVIIRTERSTESWRHAEHVEKVPSGPDPSTDAVSPVWDRLTLSTAMAQGRRSLPGSDHVCRRRQVDWYSQVGAQQVLRLI
jgi:hypothetical protein